MKIKLTSYLILLFILTTKMVLAHTSQKTTLTECGGFLGFFTTKTIHGKDGRTFSEIDGYQLKTRGRTMRDNLYSGGGGAARVTTVWKDGQHIVTYEHD